MLANLQQLGYTQMTPIQAASLPLALEGRDLIAQAQTGSGKIARHAQDGCGVAAIGGDGDIDDGIGDDSQRGRGGRAHHGIGFELDDAVMVFAQQQFTRRTHHAARFHAADGADLQRIAGGGDNGAGPRQHHLDAGARIGSAADDLQGFRSGTDTAKPQLVGVGVLFGGDDLADDEILQACAGVGDAFDFQPDAVQLVNDLFDSRVGIEMLFQPR